VKKIFKIISENSNSLLIFLTIIALVLIINTSIESNRKASVNLVAAVELFTKLSDNTTLDHAEYDTLLSNFQGSYFGAEGREVMELLECLGTKAVNAATKDKVLVLIRQYQEIIEKRFEFFNTLFYFLILGIAIQFIFLFVSIRKVALSDVQLKESKQVLSLLNTERENERLRISSHLHDEILQDIGSLLLLPEFNENESAGSKIREISHRLRDFTYKIAPLHLITSGFRGALTDLVLDFEKKYGVKIDCIITGFSENMLSNDAGLVFYRIAQEALSNIQKHAEAQQIEIKLVASHPILILRIKDDGKGFEKLNVREKSDGRKPIGMLLMNEQAKSIGAELSTESVLKEGTEITLKYKMEKGE